MRFIQHSLLLGALLGAACNQGGPSRYDESASQAYRAAWDKRRAGDEAGYKAGLAAVAKQRGTWAGDRAAIDLEMFDEPGGGSVWRKIVEQVTQMAGARARGPAVEPVAPPAVPADPEPQP
jgi:hypothetical protein